MKNAKKVPTKKRTRLTKGKESQIEIRMYNVGFGDCFLVRMPTEEGERRVLVDCGFHSQGKGKFSDVERVERIKRDLNPETTRKSLTVFRIWMVGSGGGAKYPHIGAFHRVNLVSGFLALCFHGRCGRSVSAPRNHFSQEKETNLT